MNNPTLTWQGANHFGSIHIFRLQLSLLTPPPRRSIDQADLFITTFAKDADVQTAATANSILNHYVDAVGHAPPLPDWAAGYWHSKNRFVFSLLPSVSGNTKEEERERAREREREENRVQIGVHFRVGLFSPQHHCSTVCRALHRTADLMPGIRRCPRYHVSRYSTESEVLATMETFEKNYSIPVAVRLLLLLSLFSFFFFFDILIPSHALLSPISPCTRRGMRFA